MIKAKPKAAETVRLLIHADLPEKKARELVCPRCRVVLERAGKAFWTCPNGHLKLIPRSLLMLRLIGHPEGLPYDGPDARRVFLRECRAFRDRYPPWTPRKLLLAIAQARRDQTKPKNA